MTPHTERSNTKRRDFRPPPPFTPCIIVRNSLKSIEPLPSASTSLIVASSSSADKCSPSDSITVPSSVVEIVPSPSLSYTENAFLYAAIFSSCVVPIAPPPFNKTVAVRLLIVITLALSPPMRSVCEWTVCFRSRFSSCSSFTSFFRSSSESPKPTTFMSTSRARARPSNV